MSRDPRITELKSLAQAQLGTVLAALRVTERPRGPQGAIVMRDPFTDDHDPSLVIWTNRPGGVSWKRFGYPYQGDILNLVSYLNGWWHAPKQGVPEAIRWLRDLLGVQHMTAAARFELGRAHRAAEAARVQENEQGAVRHRAFARGLFFGARQDLRGTPGETYLRERRGLDLDDFPRGPRGGDRTPGFLRFLPSHKHIGADGITFWPCLAACCVDGKGEIAAVHRTWLRHDGRDKAPVKPARKVFPGFSGLIIPVWRGDSGMSVRQAREAGLRETLGLTEGWEDALALALACPHLRVWAAISLSNIGAAPIPEIIDGIEIHKQNDWDKLGAGIEYQRQKLRLERRFNLPIADIKAHYGKDISDTYQAA